MAKVAIYTAIAVLLYLGTVRATTEIILTRQFLDDLLENEQKSNVLNFRSCWSRQDNAKFIQLSNEPIQIFSDLKTLNLTVHDVSNKIWFVINMNCNGSFEFLDKVNAKYFASPYNWILIDAPVSDIIQLETLSFWMDSNIILASYDFEQEMYDINQIYKREQSPQIFVVESFGRWTKQRKIEDVRETRILSRRRRNTMGMNFKTSLVILHNDSLNHLHDLKDTHYDSITKSDFHIIQCVLDALNATRTILTVPTWASKDPNTGKLFGLLADLITEKVHLAGTSMFLAYDRIALVDFLSMTTNTMAGFVFRTPSLSYTSNIYYLPFSTTVWICSILLVILSTVIIYLTFKYSLNAQPKDEEHSMNRASDFVLAAISAICQMGPDLHPKKISGRISSIFFWISMLFIYTSYTANIVALLQSSSNAINSLEDLLKSSMSFGAEDTPYHRFWFPAQTEATRKAIYQTRIAPFERDFYMNLSHGVNRIRQGEFAFHMELSGGYKIIENTYFTHEKCRLKVLDYLNELSPWLAVRKNLPYKELIKITLFKIREHGLQDRIHSQVYTERPKCETIGQSFESVRLIDCYAALLFLAYGFAVSILFLLGENMVKNGYISNRCNGKKKSKELGPNF